VGGRSRGPDHGVPSGGFLLKERPATRRERRPYRGTSRQTTISTLKHLELGKGDQNGPDDQNLACGHRPRLIINAVPRVRASEDVDCNGMYDVKDKLGDIEYKVRDISDDVKKLLKR
jgi:hypothetical protein